MNLSDLLVPKSPNPCKGVAEWSEGAESQQPWGLRSPPAEAEKGGETAAAVAIRPNPPGGADSETPVVTTFPPNPPNPHGVVLKIEEPLPVTREHLKSLELEPLPEDVAFLAWHLPKCTTARNQAIREYVSRWREAMAAEPLDHCKQNRGRFAANTWLRERCQ